MKTPNRTGLLIVRLWMEGDGIDGFRARITRKLDSAGSEYTIAVAGSPDDTCDVVQKWVDAFVSTN